jgi:prepilin-type processing-associated H-X9-DG protein
MGAAIMARGVRWCVSRSPMRRGRLAGITLVEVLVVVSVIAILGAIIFPVLSRAKERGRFLVCVGNLRQIGIAFQMYTGDWGKYPWACNGQFAEPWVKPQCYYHYPHRQWLGAVLEPYLPDENSEVWRCPSDLDDPWPVLAGTGPFWKQFGSSYIWPGFDTAHTMNRDPACVLAGVSVAAVRAPSKLSLMTERRPWHLSRVTREKHCRYNNLFCDGHVAAITEAEAQGIWYRKPGDP